MIQASHFVNDVGPTALSVAPGHKWQVWSTNADPFNTNPAIGDKRNGLAFDFKQYGATFGTSAVLGTGNGMFYSITPSLDVALVGSVVKDYSGTTTATLAANNFSYTGAVDGDVGLFTATSGASYGNKNAGSAINVSINGSVTGAKSSAATGGKAVNGYVLNPRTSVTAAIGTINKVNATVTAGSATLTYNGLPQNVAGFTASGLVNGETTAVLTGLTLSAPQTSPGTYVASVSGTDQNYNLTMVNGVLQINSATDNGAVVKDVVLKSTSALPIAELKMVVICEPSSSNYSNLKPSAACK